jgi:hypothetical protein
MSVTLCTKSILLGIVIGSISTSAGWYGKELGDRTNITEAMLAHAKCDQGGLVTITFVDSSQYTCVPRDEVPPTTKAEAAARNDLAKRRK